MNSSSVDLTPNSAKAADWLAGGGELGALIRSTDWSQTPLGPIDSWPQSLRSAVSILLPSKAQIAMFWGPDLITLYNDAYRPVLGAKHPSALGRPIREVWSELWGAGLKNLFEGVLNTGEAFWAKDRPFYMERYGFAEETFFDVSYDPIRDESGKVGGLFCIVSEMTAHVVGERRLRTLRDLSLYATAKTKSVNEACRAVAEILSQNRHDLPFALIYLIDSNTTNARLAASSGLAPNASATPARIEVAPEKGQSVLWDLDVVWQSNSPAEITDVIARFGELPSGVWPEAPHTAMVIPIRASGEDHPVGFLVAGVSPRRLLDDQYRAFFELLTTQLATIIANARAYEIERRRAEALAELDRAKTAFFSNVSHEFRTPLTLLLGPVTDVLVDPEGTLPDTHRERLEIAHRNGLRLQKLVNTLLDFSRLEAGRIQASFEPIELSTLTADLASNFRAACEKAGLQLVINCPPLDEPVYVDPDMWEKIVLNLLSNAFKFTLFGEIEVSLRQLEGQIELAVRDTGVGIPEAELPKLFERFHRVEVSRGRTQEGSGIGLALVRELVKLHGGSIRVESTAGCGSRFIVSLLRGKAHLPAERINAGRTLASTALGAAPFVSEALRWLPDSANGAANSGADVFVAPTIPAILNETTDGNRSRILLADDNADMRDYVRRLFNDAYEVRAVSDGQEAWAAALEFAPDLILSDVMMPVMDGFELLRRLRADQRTREIPVVLLSARAGEESRIEGLQASADDYLVKPFSARELLATVAAHLKMARIRNESREALRASEQTLKEADRRKDEFLATLAHELRNPLAPIHNGLELIRLAKGDPPALEQVATMMQRQVEQMVRLVDDLLDVSRISRNKLELRKERANLESIVLSAIETSRPLIEGAQHKLQISLPAEPVEFEADSVRLAQAFSNLLNNAAKYSEPGSLISLTATRKGGELIVRVRDTGIGIAADKLPQIFDLFMQVDGSEERSRGGLGVGLTLVQRLIEMHGGRIEAHSEGIGKGSEFVIRLPIVAPQLPKDEKTAAGAGAQPRRRILVVDDNSDSAESMAMMLELSGHQVALAHDGLEAIEVARKFQPHVAFLDLGMPRLNGYEAARSIRQEPWGREVVLVALTGWGQEEDKRRTKAAGFNAHIVKPIEFPVLEKLLGEFSDGG